MNLNSGCSNPTAICRNMPSDCQRLTSDPAFNLFNLLCWVCSGFEDPMPHGRTSSCRLLCDKKGNTDGVELQWDEISQWVSVLQSTITHSDSFPVALMCTGRTAVLDVIYSTRMCWFLPFPPPWIQPTLLPLNFTEHLQTMHRHRLQTARPVFSSTFRAGVQIWLVDWCREREVSIRGMVIGMTYNCGTRHRYDYHSCILLSLLSI